MRPLFATAAVFALLAGAAMTPAAPKPKEDKDEAKKFEGEWKLAAWDQGGTALPGEVLGSAKWSVKGGKYRFEMGENEEEGTIAVDAGKKPAEIDLTITAGTDKGKTQVGIYKIEKDIITFCLARPGSKDRPTEFKATEDDGNILISIKKKDD